MLLFYFLSVRMSACMHVQLLIYTHEPIFSPTLSYRMKSFSTDTLKSQSQEYLSRADNKIRILFQHVVTENCEEFAYQYDLT